MDGLASNPHCVVLEPALHLPLTPSEEWHAAETRQITTENGTCATHARARKLATATESPLYERGIGRNATPSPHRTPLARGTARDQPS